MLELAIETIQPADLRVNWRGLKNARKVAEALTLLKSHGPDSAAAIAQVARLSGLDPAQVSRTVNTMPGFVRMFGESGKPAGVYYLPLFRDAEKGEAYPKQPELIDIEGKPSVEIARRISAVAVVSPLQTGPERIVERIVEVMPDAHKVFSAHYITGDELVTVPIKRVPVATGIGYAKDEIKNWLANPTPETSARLAHIMTCFAVTEFDLAEIR